MPARIIDRGRGPELEGTRITVYAVMDYYLPGDPPEEIAANLSISLEQVDAAIAYIEAHREEVEAEYRRILARVTRPLPPDFMERTARNIEEIRRRLRARAAEASADAHPGRP